MIDDFKGLTECPNCGSKDTPCLNADQVDISINWHELKVLCIWAEQWGNEKCGGAGSIYSIAQRLRAQYPDKMPLTLAEEIQDLSKSFQIQTNIKGIETDKDGNVK